MLKHHRPCIPRSDIIIGMFSLVLFGLIGWSAAAQTVQPNFTWYPTGNPTQTGVCRAGQATTFDASSTVAPAGALYVWKFPGCQAAGTCPMGTDLKTTSWTFPSVGTFYVMLTVRASETNYNSISKQVTVTANEYTVTVLPGAGCPVAASVGTGDGIVCGDGATNCAETYTRATGFHAKVQRAPGMVFLGWLINALPYWGAPPAMALTADANTLQAQCLDIRLSEVAFGHDDPNYPSVAADPRENQTAPVYYTAPHWQDANQNGVIDPPANPDDPLYPQNDRQFPVVYTRKTKPQVAAEFHLSALPPAAGTLQVRGRGPNDLDIPPTPATFDAGTHTLTLPETITNRALAQTVAIFDPLEIAWEVSVDGQHWCPAGISQNQAYVTFDVPSTTIDITPCQPPVCEGPLERPLYHTVVRVGSQGAHGKPTWLSFAPERKQVIDAIWENIFATRQVRRADGQQLTYYATEHALTESLNTETLLRYSDGNCDAWAKLFLDTLRAQGITYDNLSHYPLLRISPSNSQERLLIRDWHFSLNPRLSEDVTYPYVNIAQMPLVTFTNNTAQYHWYFDPQYNVEADEEVEDRSGMPGQGTANPVSHFKFHTVALIKEDGIEGYYDPSYGIQYDTAPLLENFWTVAIAGLYKVIQLPLSVNEMNLNAHGEDLDGNGQIENINISIPNSFLPDLIPYPIRKPKNYVDDLKENVYNY